MLVGTHFHEIQNLIWEIRSEYQNFGYALGLSSGDVAAIRETHHSNADDCFNAVLKEILKQGVTQEKLAEALESRMLGRVQLAKKVRAAIFSSGKQPVFC